MKERIYTLILQLNGNDSRHEYKEIAQIQNSDDLKKFQEKHLTELLLHTYRNVPYYQKIFDTIGIIENEKVNLSKFEEIPILTKKTLREHLKDLTSLEYTNRQWQYNFSGGSTGEPTKFIQDRSYNNWCTATNKYFFKNFQNIDEIKIKKILLWGSPRDLFEGSTSLNDRIDNWLSHTIFLNGFKMTEKDMESYVKTINTFKPQLIRGYASALYELCKFIERKNLKVYQPRIIVSSSETLNKDMREKIESTFRTKLYDFYGSRETASIAGECNEGLMHVFSFNNYVEVVDRNGSPVREGENGRVIVTNLHNYSMPFLRYEIGDMAILGPKRCTCGNFLPTLKKIHGRIEEQFITKDGNVVIGYYFVHLISVILNKGFIKKFQVIQEDYERIRILAVLDKGLPPVEKNEIEQKIKLQMGTDCQIIWEYVDDIPAIQSGKFLYTKSLVKK